MRPLARARGGRRPRPSRPARPRSSISRESSAPNSFRSSNRDEIDADIDRIRSLDKPRADQKRLSSRPIKAFAGLSLDELRCEWRRLYRSEPPRISRDLLTRGMGYRHQEIQHGGLGKATRRKLKTLAKMFRSTGRVAPNSRPQPQARRPVGTRMAWPHPHRYGD